MSVKLPKSKALSTLSLTPLIDVVFLLLCFYVLVDPSFKEEEPTFDMPLPTASEAKPDSAQKEPLIISLDRAGNLLVKGHPLTDRQLAGYLKRVVDVDPNTEVEFRGDKRCSWQQVVAVMDVCSAAGVKTFRARTSSEP